MDLKVEKRDNGPAGEKITLHWHDGVLLPITELGGKDKEQVLMDACIEVALYAADVGAPITKQRKLHYTQLLQIEKAVGFTVSNNEVKDVLAAAVLVKRLRYFAGKGKQIAGYFPYTADPHMLRCGGIAMYMHSAQIEKDREAASKAAKGREDAKLEAATVPEGYGGA